jgi:hypothetical protein
MIKKIIVLMILILISINNVNCESGNGTLTGYIFDEKSHSEYFGTINLWNGDYRVKINLDLSGIPDTFKIQNVQASNKTTWGGTPSNIGDPFYIYYSSDGTTKTELVGYGVAYVHKKAFVSGTLFDVDLTFYIDDITIDKTGSQWYIFDGGWVVFNSYYDGLYYETSVTKYNNFYNNLNCVVVPGAAEGNIYNLISPKIDQTVTYEYIYKGSFRNDYTYDVTSSFFDIDIQRTGFSETYDFKSSKIKVIDYTDDSIYYQSSYSTSNTSHFLNVDNYSYYLVRNIDSYHHLIYTFEDEEDEEDEEQPTLTTDKTYYNTSELINISYTNIDKIYDECISSFCDESYQLWIYALNTPNIPKFRQWLYSDRRDETFTLNTSILVPQTDYQLMITSGETNVVISSDIFYVYQADEYLSVSCDAITSCITYNGIKNTIYYKINNNSNIIIKDNDNNIINTYYNIIGNGSIIYTIPDDLYHANTYPNWKVYLNNTEYSTSFNKGITVYWSQFQTPTPTPTYTPTPTPDINISNTIDEFKTETQPIKDLIFGLSEIVIDNPDYNKDNIVDESEINHWFNSLIPLCIIFLLIVLYIGLKKNRND